MSTLPPTPKPGERWRHFRGDLYEVIALARCATSSLPTVVYRGADGRIWCRSEYDWFAIVKDAQYPEGVQRFVKE
jgi:hypothetical protein